MIPLLLSLFKSDYAIADSAPDRDAILALRIGNFRYSYKFLLCLTIAWLCWEVYDYQLLTTRPAVLYFPENYLSRFLMPEFPNFILFHSVVLIALACTFLLFRFSGNILAKIVLSFACLWLNMAQWGWGFFSHVSHVFILAHLLAIFLPFNHKNKDEELALYNGIVWYHFGILFTYLIAGIWKFGGLIYKLVVTPHVITWIHPDGSWINAYMGYRNNDYTIVNQLMVFEYPLIWQLGFVFIVIVQCFSIFAAFKISLHGWLMGLIFVFHFINSYAFCTIFVWQPLVISILFLPYHLVFNFDTQKIKN